MLSLSILTNTNNSLRKLDNFRSRPKGHMCLRRTLKESFWQASSHSKSSPGRSNRGRALYPEPIA
jgi:hypothetical protein